MFGFTENERKSILEAWKEEERKEKDMDVDIY